MPKTECWPGEPGQLTTFGPTLFVRIGFDPAFRPDNRTHPNLPENEFPALVDTGAQESCIDSALAENLTLPVVGRRGVAGAVGVAEVNMHLAQIHVPELNWTVYGRFAAAHLAAGGQPHRALIGRTFLRHFMLAYDGRTGSVTLSSD